MVAVARRHRRPLAAVGVLAALETVLGLAQPWPLKLAVDSAVGGHPFPSWLASFDPRTTAGRTFVVIVGTLVLVGIASALNLALTLRAARTSETIGAELRTTVMDRLLRLDASFHDHHHSGELASRLSGDVARVEDAVVSICSVVVPEVLTLVGITFVLLRLDARMAAAAALVVPGFWMLTVRRRRAVRAAERASRDEQGRLAARGIELVRNARTIQIFGQRALMMRRYGHQNRRTLDKAVAATTTEARYRPIAEMLTATVGGFCLALGISSVTRGRMSVGTLLVLMAYISRVFGPVRALSSLATSLAKASASQDRLIEVLHAEPSVVNRGELAAPAAPAEVVLRDVTFAYEPERPVLRRVNLTIPSGSFVAVVGPSGAGKTTLMQLLMRSFDATSGTIELAGRGIDDYDLDSLHAHIAYVPQDVSLFEGSVAENIAFGRPDVAFHEVRLAAMHANADAFIAALPRGYDTMLGEDGTRLSGGQRRRLSLARAIVRDAPLMLLDEPTSGLDVEAETAVLDALRAARAGRTVIAVSHHLSLALSADLVVVLDDGVVAEVGPPAALLAADGPFRRLWQAARGHTNQPPTQGEHHGYEDERLLGPRPRRQRRIGERLQQGLPQGLAQGLPQGLPQGLGQGLNLVHQHRGGRSAAASPSAIDAVASIAVDDAVDGVASIAVDDAVAG